MILSLRPTIDRASICNQPSRNFQSDEPKLAIGRNNIYSKQT